MGILNGRVAIITGAGGGLGAAHARVFAAEGACVVVNDINQAAAQKVVDEILAAGGKAVANTSDITHYSDSENAVKQAIESFGDLHVVVNNAGINRDRMFASMTEAEWDAIMSVHLKGHFCISSHAVHYWRDQSKAGKAVNARIINTTSGAGLQGSIGQSNYAAAKAGIAALTLNQAAELGRYGITANAVAPAARTGMTTAVESMAARMAAPDDGSFDYWAGKRLQPAGLAGLRRGRAYHRSGVRVRRRQDLHCRRLAHHAGRGQGDRWQPAEVGEAMQALLAAEVPAQKVYGS